MPRARLQKREAKRTHQPSREGTSSPGRRCRSIEWGRHTRGRICPRPTRDRELLLRGDLQGLEGHVGSEGMGGILAGGPVGNHRAQLPEVPGSRGRNRRLGPWRLAALLGKGITAAAPPGRLEPDVAAWAAAAAGGAGVPSADRPLAEELLLLRRRILLTAL